MNAILVDDEKRSIDVLDKLLIDYCPEINILAHSKNIDDAYEAIELHKPDLVFLDIDMPPYTGFDLLKRYDTIPFEVIFVTAYNFYAIDAIKFSALYYILKPIKVDELKEAVEKAKKKISLNSKIVSDYFQSIPPQAKALQRIIIHTHKGIELIELTSIYYLEANASYTTFHLKDNKRVTCSQKTIGEYEELLRDKGFFRTHKSYMVNLAEIASTSTKDGLEVILKNQQAIPVARRRKDEFSRILQ